MNPQKLIVILGPTSSGKSALSLKLAKKFNGEIISADSRQVYKGLDIGSGKVGKKEQRIVRHHLLDVANLKKQYTVSDFRRNAKSAIAQITSNDKIPFLVGGTAFYIYSVIDDWQIPEVKPNPKLRKQLERKTTVELFKMLKKLDPARAKTIERHNKRRLIRALEIIKFTGKPVPQQHSHILENVGMLILGLNPANLRQCIAKNVDQRFKRGLVNEVKKLMKSGVSKRRLKDIGLTYSLTADFITLLKRVPKSARSSKMWYSTQLSALKQKIITAEWQYARRQMTWFKRDTRIHWIKNQKQAKKLVRAFLET